MTDQPTAQTNPNQASSQQPNRSPVASQTGSTSQPPTQPISSGNPEQPHPIPNSNPESAGYAETVEYVEIGAESQLDPEVAEYVDEVGKDKQDLDQPIVVHGKEVATPAQPKPGPDDIILPLSREKMEIGKSRPIRDSWRWLSTWCERIIHKFSGKVFYSNAPSPKDQ